LSHSAEFLNRRRARRLCNSVFPHHAPASNSLPGKDAIVVTGAGLDGNLVDEFPVALSEALGGVEGLFFVAGGVGGVGVRDGYSDESGIWVLGRVV